MPLGQKIKELRIEQGLSCAELARRTGYAVSTLHGIENGVNVNPSFKVIRDISDVLGISLDELKTFSNSPTGNGEERIIK